MMPMDRSKYPTNWNEIARGVKDAAGWKCAECGAEHDTHIIRDRKNPYKWRLATETDMLIDGITTTRVIMAVHHIGAYKPDGSPGNPNDKMDCRKENLICLCQRCHLIADLANHITARHRNKRQKLLDLGQQEIW